ncbi:hypothetical protein K0B03_00945 [Patescibacteria group bacterium]|nr:hypothetical protein [Patescibacteria group bacterium]
MKLKAGKIKDVPHYIISVGGIEQKEGMVQGVVICSDVEIEVTRIENNEIEITVTDENPDISLQNEPRIIAINANPALAVSKKATGAKSMIITVSKKKQR